MPEVHQFVFSTSKLKALGSPKCHKYQITTKLPIYNFHSPVSCTVWRRNPRAWKYGDFGRELEKEFVSTELVWLATRKVRLQVANGKPTYDDPVKSVAHMVNTKKKGKKAVSTEELDIEGLREIISAEVAQMKDELTKTVNSKVEAAMASRASGSDSSQTSRVMSYKELTVCQPPFFQGQKDPIASTR
ncbi:hypothetical protein OSB04_023960 [Centaurea solstitialis]|uniref:Uncharacterized protein n=1 Tax=Centaurea solstitialis TaxID=347529 RepID=A0AA38T4R6_9ASTR|nr:hypothetical protein OSB04_023960 [Centaurea solstitialis]